VLVQELLKVSILDRELFQFPAEWPQDRPRNAAQDHFCADVSVIERCTNVFALIVWRKTILAEAVTQHRAEQRLAGTVANTVTAGVLFRRVRGPDYVQSLS